MMRPKARAWLGPTLPEMMGRRLVRSIRPSMSRSYQWLSALAAPAAMAVPKRATTISQGAGNPLPAIRMAGRPVTSISMTMVGLVSW
ncbi:hypothetical protein D3C86_1419500 [compost metagenome]